MNSSTLDLLCTSDAIVDLIVVHGLGAGGGERVAEKILGLLGSHVRIVHHADGSKVVLKHILEGRRHGRILCAAGPRDVWVIMLAKALGRSVDAYVQVPYLRSLTLRDPVHALGVMAYYLALNLSCRAIYANSESVRQGLSRKKSRVILPVTRAELSQVARVPVGAASPSFPGATARRIVFVCRLVPERGRGSRDIDAMLRLCREVSAQRSGGGAGIEVWHFGACAELYRRKIVEILGDGVTFFGVVPNWLEQSQGQYVFLSRYEGFGLAAFEAARAGRNVFVNEAFPNELLQVQERIVRISSGGGKESILSQIYGEAESNTGGFI